MSFELLDSISLPGDPAKANEDAFENGPAAAVVLDGATGLGENLLPGPSDAAWIARFGARRLLAHLAEGQNAEGALAQALADAEKSFAGLRRRPPREKWEIPYASMMLAVVARAKDGEEELDFLYFGDCGALVGRPGAAVESVGETIARRAAEAARAAALAAEKNLPPAAGLHREEFIVHLRAARARVGSGRNWLFGPDLRAAAHAGRKRIAVPKQTLILLATDGFLALASDYGRYDAGGLLAAARARGLAALAAEIRAIEEGDRDGVKFPRFKKSDDSTALLLQVV